MKFPKIKYFSFENQIFPEQILKNELSQKIEARWKPQLHYHLPLHAETHKKAATAIDNDHALNLGNL